MSGAPLKELYFKAVQRLWRNFYPGDPEPMSTEDNRVKLTNVFFIFFQDENSGRPLLSHVNWVNNGSVYFDCSALERLLHFTGFLSEAKLRPREILGAMGLALGLVAIEWNHCHSLCPIVLYPRLVNVEPHELPFDNLRSGIVGQLVSLRGYVVKASPLRPLIEGATFECQTCGYEQWVRFDDGLFTPPEICGGQRDDKNGRPTKCRAKYPVLNRSKCKSSVYQRIKLQELDHHRVPTGVEDAQARIPRSFEIEARGVLVNRCIPGNVIEVVGILQAAQLDGGKGKQGRDSALCSLYLLANTISVIKGVAKTASSSTNAESYDAISTPRELAKALALDSSGNSALHSTGGAAARSSLENFTQEELVKIGKIACSDNCLSLLVSSLCPSIFGQDVVKLGLLLGLLGGTARNTCTSGADPSSTQQPPQTRSSTDVTDSHADSNPQGIRVRTDIHVLVVGDPGLGKSQMLRAAAAVAPRSVLVCGNTATTAGLTVTVSREGHGEVALEAGALVLADQGVCCLDELDKMTCDYHALLEAMEQQSISVAKSGMVASIRTRTTVLAAANPSQGHYSRLRSVCDNLKMPAALLSRFDLIFILMDKRDAQHDKMIASHILGTHALAKSGLHSTAAPGSVQDDDEFITVSQRLRRQCGMITSDRLIPTDLLRRYIEYARKHVHPQLSRKAAKVLQVMYLTMRSQASLGKSIPVTTRNLESLIRLAQARARAELRDSVTEEDAKDVVDLLQESLIDAFSNEIGGELFSKSGKMGGTIKQARALFDALRKESAKIDSKLFHFNQISSICARLNLERDAETLVDKLHSEGFILQKPNRNWELS